MCLGKGGGRERRRNREIGERERETKHTHNNPRECARACMHVATRERPASLHRGEGRDRQQTETDRRNDRSEAARRTDADCLHRRQRGLCHHVTCRVGHLNCIGTGGEEGSHGGRPGEEDRGPIRHGAGLQKGELTCVSVRELSCCHIHNTSHNVHYIMMCAGPCTRSLLSPLSSLLSPLSLFFLASHLLSKVGSAVVPGGLREPDLVWRRTGNGVRQRERAAVRPGRLLYCPGGNVLVEGGDVVPSRVGEGVFHVHAPVRGQDEAADPVEGGGRFSGGEE